MNISDIAARRLQILHEIASITVMERGTLTPFPTKPGSPPNYRLQCWVNGKNLTRYITADKAPAVQSAIDAYKRFESLTREFAELTISQSRLLDDSDSGSKKNARTRPK